MLVRLITWTIVIYLGYCGLLFFLQRKMLFPRDLAEPLPSASGIMPGVEKTWLTTSSGNVEAWFMPPEARQRADNTDKPFPVIIFAHGNAELIDYQPPDFKPLIRMGFGILFVEYPGYGRSEGSPSEKRIAEVFLLAYDRLVAEKNVDKDRIVLMGRSLGSGPVCNLAAKRPSAALVLTSAFTSARSFAIRYLVPGFMVLDPFDNLSVIRQYDNPVLIAHGRQDEIIPFHHGQTLQKSARNARLIAYDSHHNDCPPDWFAFLKELEEFFSENGILEADERESPEYKD